jgi:hypothetical protein
MMGMMEPCAARAPQQPSFQLAAAAAAGLQECQGRQETRHHHMQMKHLAARRHIPHGSYGPFGSTAGGAYDGHIGKRPRATELNVVGGGGKIHLASSDMEAGLDSKKHEHASSKIEYLADQQSRDARGQGEHALIRDFIGSCSLSEGPMGLNAPRMCDLHHLHSIPKGDLPR